MADVSLNGLKVKTDSLPNGWYVSLINPKDGEPAEIMTVARFVELFTSKQPEVTESSKGLMSAKSLISNPSSYAVNRKYVSVSITPQKAYRLKIKKANDNVNFVIKLLSGWVNGMSHGVLEKVISFGGGDSNYSKALTCSAPICNVYYISDPYYKEGVVNVDIINKANGNNNPVIMLESFHNFDGFEFLENQVPRAEDITKNNRNETDFALKTSVNTLAASQNALTDTISDNYSILPPPANCVPNYSESAGSEEQFAVSAMSETDNSNGSIPVKSESTEVQEQYVWSIDKIGKAVLELQEENKRLKQILTSNGIEVNKE